MREMCKCVNGAGRDGTTNKAKQSILYPPPSPPLLPSYRQTGRKEKKWNNENVWHSLNDPGYSTATASDNAEEITYDFLYEKKNVIFLSGC